MLAFQGVSRIPTTPKVDFFRRLETKSGGPGDFNKNRETPQLSGRVGRFEINSGYLLFTNQEKPIQ